MILQAIVISALTSPAIAQVENLIVRRPIDAAASGRETAHVLVEALERGRARQLLYQVSLSPDGIEVGNASFLVDHQSDLARARFGRSVYSIDLRSDAARSGSVLVAQTLDVGAGPPVSDTVLVLRDSFGPEGAALRADVLPTFVVAPDVQVLALRDRDGDLFGVGRIGGDGDALQVRVDWVSGEPSLWDITERGDLKLADWSLAFSGELAGEGRPLHGEVFLLDAGQNLLRSTLQGLGGAGSEATVCVANESFGGSAASIVGQFSGGAFVTNAAMDRYWMCAADGNDPGPALSATELRFDARASSWPSKSGDSFGARTCGSLPGVFDGPALIVVDPQGPAAVSLTVLTSGPNGPLRRALPGLVLAPSHRYPIVGWGERSGEAWFALLVVNSASQAMIPEVSGPAAELIVVDRSSLVRLASISNPLVLPETIGTTVVQGRSK